MRHQDEALLAAFNSAKNPRTDRFVYVAGKFRGKNPWEVESNIRYAEDYSMRLWELGVPNICPHTIGRHLEGVVPDSFVLPVMVSLMLKCDAVLVLPGWEESSGTRGEMKEAHEHGMPIFTSVQHAVNFILEDDRRGALLWRTEFGPEFSVRVHPPLTKFQKMLDKQFRASMKKHGLDGGSLWNNKPGGPQPLDVQIKSTTNATLTGKELRQAQKVFNFGKVYGKRSKR